MVQPTEGLVQKYLVERLDGRDQEGGDRSLARYFVLDVVHDMDARAAIYKYATMLERNDKLAADILKLLLETEQAAFDFRIKQGPVNLDYADEVHIQAALLRAEGNHEVAYSNEANTYLRRNAYPVPDQG